MSDIRLDVDFCTHPKIIKLRRRLGDPGVLALIRLWCYAGKHRSTGELSDMDAEDIAIACDWTGEAQELIAVLEQLRLLDQEANGYAIHNWQTRNPWVVESGDRSDEARLSRLFRTNPEKAQELKSEGRTGITSEEYREFKTPLKYDRSTERSTTVVRPYNDRSTERSTNCGTNRSTPAPAPAPALKTPPPPPYRTDAALGETATACGGGGDVEKPNGVNGVEPVEDLRQPAAKRLEWPTQIRRDERPPLQAILDAYPVALAQTLLDELTGAIRAGKIKSSPAGYLRGLAKRAAAGTFTPEAATVIAQERAQRLAAESAYQAALQRPSVAETLMPPRDLQLARHHLKDIKAMLGMKHETREPQSESQATTQ